MQRQLSTQGLYFGKDTPGMHLIKAVHMCPAASAFGCQELLTLAFNAAAPPPPFPRGGAAAEL